MTTEEKVAIKEMFEDSSEQPVYAAKYDGGKLDWHSFPLIVMEGIIQVAVAGCLKYDRFNCLKQFENGNERLFSAAMRHTVACQIDPLAVDDETGCRHGYQAAWGMIMRTYHAEQEVKNGH